MAVWHSEDTTCSDLRGDGTGAVVAANVAGSDEPEEWPPDDDCSRAHGMGDEDGAPDEWLIGVAALCSTWEVMYASESLAAGWGRSLWYADVDGERVRCDTTCVAVRWDVAAAEDVYEVDSRDTVGSHEAELLAGVRLVV